MKRYFHSVTLDRDRCKGCTNCIKRCPTEAIRVRNGKAKIIKERCIDCGECIRVCPYHAKRAVTDSFDRIHDFQYTIALPAPALYVQFHNRPDINVILTSLKKLGFDDVFEVARGAELITLTTKQLLAREELPRPAISSACPAVVRMIRNNFPNLIDHVVPLVAPLELAATIAKERALLKTGLPADEIGVFFITPCAAKVTYSHSPIGVESSLVDGCISMSELYPRLLPVMQGLKQAELLATASIEGINWAKNGGESVGLETENYIAVDGIHDVIGILEQLDDGKIYGIDFIEASACVGGCIGGPLTVENPFVSRVRINNVLTNTRLMPSPIAWSETTAQTARWKVPMKYSPVAGLGETMEDAMEKMEQVEAVYKTMPQLDCGSCGAPSCRAMAEDIIRGFAQEEDCVFTLRAKMRDFKQQMANSELSEQKGDPSDDSE